MSEQEPGLTAPVEVSRKRRKHLSDFQKNEMVKRALAGESRKDLAAEYGVDPQTVWLACRKGGFCLRPRLSNSEKLTIESLYKLGTDRAVIAESVKRPEATVTAFLARRGLLPVRKSASAESIAELKQLVNEQGMSVTDAARVCKMSPNRAIAILEIEKAPMPLFSELATDNVAGAQPEGVSV